MNCKACGKEVNPLDIALTKKIVNRGAEQFFCCDCLCKEFNITKEFLLEKAQYFKDSGCLLFDGIEIPKK